MNLYVRSMIVGFAATVILSLLMVMKAAMGMMPQLDVIAMLGRMAESILGKGGPGIGWILHFLIGTVLWGVSFALLYEQLPGVSPELKGISFGLLAWFLMMVLLMPIAGAGMFGMTLSLMAPAVTVVLHVIWGAVLGFVFRLLPTATESRAAGLNGPSA